MGKWGYSEPSLWWAALHWNVVHDSTAFSFSVAALHIPCKVLAYFLTLSSWKFIVSLSPRIHRPPLVALLVPVWCKEGAKFHFPLQSLVNPVPFIESAFLTEPCCLPSLLSVWCPLLDSLISCIGPFICDHTRRMLSSSLQLSSQSWYQVQEVLPFCSSRLSCLLLALCISRCILVPVCQF